VPAVSSISNAAIVIEVDEPSSCCVDKLVQKRVHVQLD